MYMSFPPPDWSCWCAADQLWQIRWRSRISSPLNESLTFVRARLQFPTFRVICQSQLALLALGAYSGKLKKKKKNSTTFNFWLLFDSLYFLTPFHWSYLTAHESMQTCTEHTIRTWIINAYQPVDEFRQTATDLYWFAKVNYYQRSFTFTKQWLKFKCTCKFMQRWFKFSVK